MANARDVKIDVIANDKTERGTRSAERNLDRLDRKVKSIDKNTGKMASALGGLEGKLKAAGGGATRAAVGFTKFAGAAAAVAANVPALGALGPVLVALAATAAPAAAALGVFGAVGATAFARIQEASEKGLKNLPPDLDKAVKGFDGLKKAWSDFVTKNSPETLALFTQGFRTLKNLLPSLQPLFDAGLGAAQRFMGFVDRKLADGTIQRLVEWLGDKSAAALKKLGDATGPVTETVKKFFQVWKDNEATIDRVRTALAGVALVAGIASGGWLIALGGAVALVATHWDELKSAARTAGGQLSSSGDKLSGMARDLYSWWNDKLNPALRDAFKNVWPHVRDGIERVTNALDKNRPAWEKLGTFITKVLIPILGVTLGAAIDQSVAAWEVLIWTAALVVNSFDDIVTGIEATDRGVRFVALSIERSWNTFIAQVLRATASFLRNLGSALGAIPGMGESAKRALNRAADGLDAAAGRAEAEARRIQSAIDRIHGKNVDINIKTRYTTTGNGTAAGPLKSVAFSAGRDVAFAGAGQYRTTPPQPVTVSAPAVSNSFTVLIDGQPVRAIVRQEIDQAAGRARSGRAYA